MLEKHNYTAIYTIKEDGREFYFATDTAGGYSLPPLVYDGAVRMKAALNQVNVLGKLVLEDIITIARGHELFPEPASGQRLFRPLDETEMITRLEDFSERPDIFYSITLDFDAKTIHWEFNPATGRQPVTMPVGVLNTSFNLRQSFVSAADKSLPGIEFNEQFVRKFIEKYTKKPQNNPLKAEATKNTFNVNTRSNGTATTGRFLNQLLRPRHKWDDFIRIIVGG